MENIIGITDFSAKELDALSAETTGEVKRDE